MKIAVAGASGTVGRYVVTAAQQAGHDVVALCRAQGVDVLTGEGLDAALDGIEVVVDTLNSASTARAQATEFFVRTTDHLQAGAAAAGARRLVTCQSWAWNEFVDTATTAPSWPRRRRRVAGRCR